MSGSLMFPWLLSHIHAITLAIVRKVVHIEAHDSADDAIIGYKHNNDKNTLTTEKFLPLFNLKCVLMFVNLYFSPTLFLAM